MAADASGATREAAAASGPAAAAARRGDDVVASGAARGAGPERVDALLGELEEIADGRARETALAAVQALVELYGDGLARIVERAGPELTATLAGDDLVGHLLVAHDLHPEPVEERIGAALDEVRPYLGSHGGGVELLGVEGGVARLRLEGSCSGCPASATTLESAVEQAIRRRVPEIEAIEAEDAPDGGGGPPPQLLQIENVDGGQIACPADDARAGEAA